LVLNNIEAGRYRIVMLMKSAKTDQWQVIRVIEDDEALPNEQRKEFSYPYLISANGDDAHLVYTWDRKKIRHMYFSPAWLVQAYGQIALSSTPSSDAVSKEVKQ
jgi:predicted neuraminidase